MIEHAVVIAGGGPTGMMLAGELALAGIDVAIVERRTSPDLDGSRAGGLHARTIEVLDQRGIADRFLAAGQAMQVQSFATIPLDIGDFPTRHNYGLALWQKDFERIVGAWVDEQGVPVYRGREVTGFTQDGTGIDVELSGSPVLKAEYLVGCDGGRSLVRKAAGIEFPGWDPTRSTLIAEAEVIEEPSRGIHRDSTGVHGIHRMEDGRTVRVVVTERQPRSDGDPTLGDVSDALITVWGTDFGVHSPTWISRFTDMTRQAASYRKDRVLLAGDAAHVHYPVGGQGLNTGVQDAVNLGWKLAQVVKGTSPESLLDTYHAERHPVAARVLQNTMAQTVLARSDERIDALRDTMTELLGMAEPRKRLAAMISGLDIHYDLGEGHPLLGRRMPDLELATAHGPVRVFTLLHNARPVLLNFGEPGTLDISPWADRVQLVDAAYAGAWELPVLGAALPPAAVLVRPDGHAAWVGGHADAGLTDALTVWFGPPVTSPKAMTPQDGDGEHRAEGRPMRADGKRSYERLVVAAREVFAAEGEDASMEAVARKAEVGVGTLYRHFPSRIDLVEAVHTTDVDELIHTAEHAMAELEPWPAVVAYLEAFVHYARSKRMFLSELREAFEKNPDLKSANRERVDAVTDLVIRRAQKAGAVRTDVDGADVTQVISPMCTSLTITEEQTARLLPMILDGLRANSKSMTSS